MASGRPTAARPARDPARARLAYGLVVSVMLHAGVAAAVFVAGAAGPRDRGERDASRSPLDPPRERLQLGLQQSEQVTMNWLGFDNPTPHQAVLADSSQAALSRAAVGPEEEPTPTATPSAAQVAQQAPESEPTPPPPVDTEPDAVESEAPPIVQTPAPPLPVPEQMVFETDQEAPPPELDAPVPQEPKPPAPEAQPRPELETEDDAEPSPAPAREEASEADQEPTPASEAEPSGGADEPGIVDEREASATSDEIVLELDELGKPAAGQGLEIITKRIRWTSTARLLGVRRNPIVLIKFGADGKVREVDFVREKRVVRNTGSDQIDEQLLNGIYSWTAKGARIDALRGAGRGAGPGAEADPTLGIRMRISLIGG